MQIVPGGLNGRDNKGEGCSDGPLCVSGGSRGRVTIALSVTLCARMVNEKGVTPPGDGVTPSGVTSPGDGGQTSVVLGLSVCLTGCLSEWLSGLSVCLSDWLSVRLSERLSGLSV
ncbi:unnamed protein product [Gadus morhua 'NCC']